jgi:hypothetical protein
LGRQNRTEHLFIVRIWQETGQPAGAAWRGQVEHAPSRRRMYFSNLRDLDDFIAMVTGRPESFSPPEDARLLQ